MEHSIEEIKEKYQRLSDEALIKLASEEAEGLREDAQRALIDEMNARNFPKNVFKAMHQQLLPLDGKVVLELAESVRNQPCPVCSSTRLKLNASLCATATGFVLISFYEANIKIACPACLDKKHSKANAISLLLGWWSLPGGLYQPIQAFTLNWKQQKQNHQEQPTDTLLQFVKQNVGRLQANMHKPNNIQSILANAELK